MLLLKYSIIICTQNRALLLKKCLNSLRYQDFQKTDYEIIVVDDGSSDETAAVLTEFPNRQPRLLALHQSTSGPAQARNLGAKAASGEVLVFLDDDTEAPTGWLAAIQRTFLSHPEAQGVGSHAFITFHSGSLDKRRHWRNPSDDAAMPFAFEPQKWLSTHNLAVKRSAFDAVGGFLHENICHDEDLDFLYRLLQKGFILIRTSQTMIRHQSRETMAAITRQQFHFGRTDAHIFQRFFPQQLVLDFAAGRYARLPDFFHLDHFPINLCLRLDFFKGFLCSLVSAVWWWWLPLAYLLVLWAAIFSQARNPVFSLVLLRTLLVREAAYMAGHLRGSWETGTIYI